MMKNIVILLTFLVASTTLEGQKTLTLTSPDGTVTVDVHPGCRTTYSVSKHGTMLLAPSPVSMTLGNGEILGENVRIKKVERRSEKKTYRSPFYISNKVEDRFNEMTLHCHGDYSMVFRAYDNGVAYRLATGLRGGITVVREQAGFNLPGNPLIYASYVNIKASNFEGQFFNSFENLYEPKPLAEHVSSRLIHTPALAKFDNGMSVLITESDLRGYPGMFLHYPGGEKMLEAVFAPYPKHEKQGGHHNLQIIVTEREDFIARTNGKRDFPWRVVLISQQDKDLLCNHVPYLLAEPSRLDDVSWIQPGKAAWEWWNDWNISGVGFRSGINDATYRYYIDFASDNRLEYVVMDEGWCVENSLDLMRVVPGIDLPGLVAYATERNVGLILWAGCRAMAGDAERVVAHYSKMGIKGFKIDFCDRDDQKMVDFTYDMAELCARHKMVIDFHGIFKPAGLQRTFPNVLNFEGVAGLEQMKWQPESYDMITHDVTLPFIRMVNGPMDYTQGAMRNSVPGEYRPNYSHPMSQGTRCRQLAEYVVFFSPLVMLCDSPSAYIREPESTAFIRSVPTVWDETVALDGSVGEYVVVARRKGNKWYVGGLTDRENRVLDVRFDFLGDGEYVAGMYADGVNADRNAMDYRVLERTVTAKDTISLMCQPGGGFAMSVTGKNESQ